jgi:sec-independent protein translocase protein TatB
VFNLSGSEIVVILLLALVVLGPEKLPEAIRRFGRVYGELRRMSKGFQSEFKEAFDEPMRELRATAQMTTEAVRQAIEEPEPPRPNEQPGTSDETPRPENEQGT